jgi:hypothetical protein
MSPTVPSIDSEEYRIEKENRMAKTLAKRREIRDRIELKYYELFCDKVNNIPENLDRFKSELEVVIQLIENLRDDVDEKNELDDLIHCQCLKTVTEINNYLERIISVVETITSNEKAFLINQDTLVMEIASLKKRQNQEYYDIRRYFLLIFMIVVPLFPFFKK